jgi:hypothetical protein
MNPTLFDFLVLAMLGAIVVGVILLLNGSGGGGLNTPRVVPTGSSPNSGGFQPGFVSSQVRNGGRGAASPNVLFN